jgi:hypothetical protein
MSWFRVAVTINQLILIVIFFQLIFSALAQQSISLAGQRGKINYNLIFWGYGVRRSAEVKTFVAELGGRREKHI